MSADVLVHGVILGLVYGLLAVGVVVVFRASNVVNFAHGETGALAATVLAKLVLDEHWPFALAFVVTLAVGAAIGAATEMLVARPLRARPRLALLVATIGLAQVLLVVHLLLPDVHQVAPFPTPIHRRITIGSVVLSGRDFLPLAAIPAVVIGLWLWLSRTPSGLALRAAGDNRDAATLAGFRPERIAVTAWALAGALAALAAVLADPLQGVVIGRPTEALGVGLLLRALAAALIGRMTSIPLALGGGVAVGIVQAVANNGHHDPAAADVLILVLVLAAVVFRPVDPLGRHDRNNELARVPRPDRLAGLAVAVIALTPIIVGRSSELFSVSRVVVYATVGLSLVVLTGWTGPLSLGQFAVVGVGTFAAAGLEGHGVPFLLTVPLAAATGAAVSALIGLPALRLRGVELAITTLALAVACSTWVFPHWVDGSGSVTVTRATATRGPVAYFELCVAGLAVAVVAVEWMRRTDVGRRLLAVRSDERRAAALGIPPVAVKLAAFAVAGAIAGGAGALLGGLRIHSTPADFSAGESLRIVAITVIGGVGSAAGAVVGAVFVLGTPALFGTTTIAGLLPSGLGLLVLALIAPGGLVSVLPRRRAGAPTSIAVPPLVGDGGRLEVDGVTVRFGGRLALDQVTVTVEPGEVVAIVGANGAGKSTLLDVISGFTTPAAGGVRIDGRDLGGVRPASRARAGLGRVVQDAQVIDDLTVAELMALVGSASDLDVRVADLPAGSRRLVEVAAAAARHPRVLLLDEPTARLTADEIARFEAALGGDTMSIVIVEHDAALVSRIADRIVVLDTGRVVDSHYGSRRGL